MKAVHRARGMTLVEVVVALSILSMVVVMLGASVRGMGQSAERVDIQIEQADHMRVVSAFLRELMTRATFQRNTRTGQPLHAAGPDQLVWVGSMPARPGGPAGRHFFKLAVETAEGAAPALVLRFVPWQDGVTAVNWAQSDSRVIVPEVAQFQLAYGGAGLEQGWTPQWTSPHALPPRLRLTLVTQALQWPPLVMPIRTLQPAPEVSFGGGA
jgi:general secretion pathway protein J